MKVLILAGGGGVRLWPLSRQHWPKQFIRFPGMAHTLFQQTVLRSLELADAQDICVVTHRDHLLLVQGELEQIGLNLEDVQVVVEPVSRNTLPAIVAGVQALAGGDGAVVAVFPSDHRILHQARFVEVIRASEELARQALVTFGIQPDEPHTGYGYIAPGTPRLNGFNVRAFHEKPEREGARTYIREGYLWNSGIFLLDSRLFMEEVRLHAPGIDAAFRDRSPEEAFHCLEEGISIDYGLLEKSTRVAVVPADVGWSDLGNFQALYDLWEPDAQGNVAGKEDVLVHSSGNLLLSDSGKLMAAVGIEDCIVVDTRDALLVCNRNHHQAVREVVSLLEDRNDGRFRYPLEDHRPWGSYRVLEQREGFRVKRMTVHPGKRLSYQTHQHRSEHWTVARGTAKVTLDDQVRILRTGEGILIGAGQKHRMENVGPEPLEVIEVQIGERLDEDDIRRLDDDYGRA